MLFRSPIRYLVTGLALLTLSAGLSGCGQKGSLYLPEEEEAEPKKQAVLVQPIPPGRALV